jgi:hypothetical protein
MPHLDILPTMLENDKRNTGSFVKTLDQKGYIPEGSDHISKNFPQENICLFHATKIGMYRVEYYESRTKLKRGLGKECISKCNDQTEHLHLRQELEKLHYLFPSYSGEFSQLASPNCYLISIEIKY